MIYFFFFFFSSRRRHTRCSRDWSSDVCSSDLEDEVARPGEARRLLEELGIRPLDRGEMAAKIGGEGIGVAIAEEDRKTRNTVAIGGQAMDLRVIDHLQPVLDPPQKPVILGQPCGRRRIDAAGCGQPPQGGAGRPNAQFRDPATPDQLLRLREKFDFPDAAAAGLDVVTLDRDSSAALMRLDLPLD